MEDFFVSIFDFLIANYALYMVVVIGVLMSLIILFLNLIKKPIKKATQKIKTPVIQTLANKVLILISFGVAVMFWALLNWVLPQYFEFNGVNIFLTGAVPVVLYALSDKVITNGKAKELFAFIKSIFSKGKIKEQDVKDLVNALSVDNDIVDDITSAEEELNQHLK